MAGSALARLAHEQLQQGLMTAVHAVEVADREHRTVFSAIGKAAENQHKRLTKKSRIIACGSAALGVGRVAQRRSALSGVAQVQRFDALTRPLGTTQEFQAGFDAGFVLEAAHRNQQAELFLVVAPDEPREDRFERQAVQWLFGWVLGISLRRRGHSSVAG